MMSTQLLEIQPKELKFILELKKQSSCTVQLTNNTYHNVAFKVKTTSPKKYCVRPNVGIMMPKSTCEFTVTMQAQKVAPPDMVCRDKFLIQSTIVPVGTTDKDITSSMFAKDDGKFIEEVKLKVALICSPESPVLSPINGLLKQGSFFEASVPKDPVINRAEIVTPPQMHQVVKDIESKIINGQEFNSAEDSDLKPKNDVINGQEFITSNDAESKPKKDMFNGQELKPTKDLLSNMDVDTGKEFKPSRTEELKPEKDAFNEQQPKPTMDAELPSVKDEELSTVKAVEEQKLVSDIEEMKSKLLVLESKLNEAESTISKLAEERRLSSQERKILQDELAMLRSRKSVKTVYVGFPLLFVVMVALIGMVLGYLSRS